MSKEQIYADEVARRRLDVQGLQESIPDINATVEQNSDLDETYKSEQQGFKEQLECIYKETRHYSGKWPIVYSNAQTERYPYIKETDDLCNPYYRISEIEAGNNEGLAPQFSEPTRSGAASFNRDRNYTREDTLRSTALTALQAYPDRSTEGTNATGGSCSDPQYTDQASCLAAGGVPPNTWSPDYAPGDTAPEKLQNALNPWRAAIVQLKDDLCTSQLEDTGNTAANLLQNIIDEIDVILAELPPIPTYPDETPDPTYECSNPAYITQSGCELNGHTWFSTLQDAIDQVIDYINTNMPSDIDSREAPLTDKANLIEKKHFGIIGLRLHQINGSFTKVKQFKQQKKDVESLIQDHIKAIADINVLRANNS